PARSKSAALGWPSEMIDLTRAGVADDDTLGQPSAADFERAGIQPLDAAEREKLQAQLEAFRRGPAPSDWTLPLEAGVETRGLPGRASVWVDDHRVGPVAAGEDSGWAVLAGEAGLATGEHVLLIVQESGASPDTSGRRSWIVVRLASTGQDVVMMPTLADTVT